MLGKVDGARRIVAELRTRVGRHVAVFEPQLRLTEGWLAAADGTVSLAVDKALDAARLAAESGQHGFEMLALHDAVRFGDRDCAPRLLELASTIGGSLAQAYRDHAVAVVGADADAVRAAAEGSSGSVPCSRRRTPSPTPRRCTGPTTTSGRPSTRRRRRTDWPGCAVGSAHPR